ncbi:hypothetical protein AXX17_AT1G53290 [Arabidopsis thaliana]|uniref:Transmembrane protein n=1 Tax=Arabidopsis thaliana TaxID=3702 RepID=A0A178WLN0_ARATH|nr:hypothetical protein AXX17_AT1G53290 [Arabidopsis thaliana]
MVTLVWSEVGGAELLCDLVFLVGLYFSFSAIHSVFSLGLSSWLKNCGVVY